MRYPALLVSLWLLAAAPASAQIRAQGGATASDVPIQDEPGNALRPVVVAIAIKRGPQPKPSPNAKPSPLDPEVEEFFRRFFTHKPGALRPLGTGLVTTADGYILTTAAIGDARGQDEIIVRFADGAERPARVIGSDSRTALGLLKVEGAALPAARFGDLNRVKVNDPVLGLAYPRSGAPQADTKSGQVRAVETAMNSNVVAQFLETNLGNVDGPVFNQDGEVIGINAYYYSKEPERGFAVPIQLALAVQEDLRRHGRVIRGRLGFTQQQVTAALATSFGLSSPEGTLVVEVEAGGPAARAGVLANDIILEINGRPVRNPNEAAAIVTGLRPGTTATIVVWRDRQRRSLSAVAGEQVER
jgi:serine protease Do